VRFYWLVLGILVVWRLTHLLQAEDGPFELIIRLRRRLGDGFWGGLLDCFQCLSLWIAAPLAYFLGQSWTERLFLWPALSGAAILLQKATEGPPEPVYYEEGEHDVLLRTAESEPARVSDPEN
jgi:hypothetical protein